MGQHEPREVEMTGPVEEIRVECPRCGTVFDDWKRGSINLNLEDVDDDYTRQASTATCPECGHVVELGTLVVRGDVWETRVRGENDAAAEALRRLDPENELLRPDAFRGTLWFQAVAWEIDRLSRSQN
jgi:ribosomal protein S27AE